MPNTGPDRRPNVERLRRVFEKITADPKSWDQGTWIFQSPSCGTIACIAGHTVLMAGYVGFSHDNIDADHVSFCHPAGQPEDVRLVCVVATELLGVTPLQANWLFYSGRTRDDVEKFLVGLEAGEHEIDPDWVPSVA